MKRLLITGATGFIGGELVKFYTRQGYEVMGLARSKKPVWLNPTKTTYIQADLSKDNLPKEVDIIIHAAGLASDQASYKDLYANNVMSTQRLYESVNHKLFIHISSSSVYQNKHHKHYEEEVIDLKKLTLYGRSKYEAEKVLEVRNKSRIYILRPRSVYGINDTTLLPKIMNLKKGKYILAPGGLKYKTSMTHIDNLILAVDLCIKDDSWSREKVHLYNVADSNVYQLHSVIKELLQKIFNKKLKQIYIPTKVLYFAASVLSILPIHTRLNKTALNILCQDNELSIDKIKNELGYEPLSSFDSSVSSMATWFRDKSKLKSI